MITAEDIPNDLYEAADKLEAGLVDEDKGYILQNGAIGLHHTLGRYLRNTWGLWEGSAGKHSPLRDWFLNRGLGHADDMSAIILDYFTSKLRHEEFDLDSAIEYYRHYWEDLGINPLTQEKI